MYMYVVNKFNKVLVNVSLIFFKLEYFKIYPSIFIVMILFPFCFPAIFLH